MPNLFNRDIAGIINKALGPQLLVGTLTQRRLADPEPGQPKGAVNYNEQAYPFRGIIKSLTRRPRDNTTVKMDGQSVLILGASLPPGVVPDVGDSIDIEDQSFKIGAVKRDPAAATYTCEVF